MMMMLLILRGASIEFYVKSTSYKQFWLNTLSLSSFLLLLSQVALCAKLLGNNTSILLGVLPFFIWFNFTRACCYLFPINRMHRLGFVLGLFISSQLLFMMLDVSIWGSKITSTVFIIRIVLLGSFLTFSIFKLPSIFFGQTLLIYVFFSNALFVLYGRVIMPIAQSTYPNPHHSHYSSYLIINLFSIIILPIIAVMLSVMKRVFMKNQDLIGY
jgi:hypothetical protein